MERQDCSCFCWLTYLFWLHGTAEPGALGSMHQMVFVYLLTWFLVLDERLDRFYARMNYDGYELYNTLLLVLGCLLPVTLFC